MCGVYMIRVGATGDFYIGGTTLSFDDRFMRWRSWLRRQKAPALLQRAWNEHAETFEFVPLKAFPLDEVHEREREAIMRLQPPLNVYVPTGRPRKQHVMTKARTGAFMFDGRMMTLSEIARRTGISRDTLKARAARGLTGPALVMPKHRAPRKPYTRHPSSSNTTT